MCKMYMYVASTGVGLYDARRPQCSNAGSTSSSSSSRLDDNVGFVLEPAAQSSPSPLSSSATLYGTTERSPPTPQSE